jgi:hypothetical protein
MKRITTLWMTALILSYTLEIQIYSMIPVFAQETNASVISFTGTGLSNTTAGVI